jgi:hypothetical protein
MPEPRLPEEDENSTERIELHAIARAEDGQGINACTGSLAFGGDGTLGSTVLRCCGHFTLGLCQRLGQRHTWSRAQGIGSSPLRGGPDIHLCQRHCRGQQQEKELTPAPSAAHSPAAGRRAASPGWAAV